jgi:hypothetical protein
MIKNTTVSKKLTSTLKVNHQLNQQSPRNSDSVYIGSNPVSPAIKSSTYTLRKNRATSTNIHIFIDFWKNCVHNYPTNQGENEVTMRNFSFPVFFLCIFILVSGCVSMKNNIKSWDRYDTARQLVVSGTLLTDWSLTDYTARHPESREEINPILGKHPSPGSVAVYFIGCGTIHTIVSALLPQKIKDDKGNPAKIFGIKVNPRALWQYFWIGTEGVFIGYSL